MMSLLKLWIVRHGRADSQASLLHTFAEEVFDGVVVMVVGGQTKACCLTCWAQYRFVRPSWSMCDLQFLAYLGISPPPPTSPPVLRRTTHAPLLSLSECSSLCHPLSYTGRFPFHNRSTVETPRSAPLWARRRSASSACQRRRELQWIRVGTPCQVVANRRRFCAAAG